MAELEVLVGELFAIDGLATGALWGALSDRQHSEEGRVGRLTLPRVKSPPWHMKSGITRWNLLPASAIK